MRCMNSPPEPKILSPETPTHRLAVVSLGANLPTAYGNSLETVYSASHELARLFGVSVMRSSPWRTDPVDCDPGAPDFINAITAFWLATPWKPRQVLDCLHALEDKYGRQRSGIRNASRGLDLDLICLGDIILANSEVRLPHPRAHLRGFVLNPLTEVLPNLILPGQSRSVSHLINGIGASSDEKLSWPT